MSSSSQTDPTIAILVVGGAALSIFGYWILLGTDTVGAASVLVGVMSVLWAFTLYRQEEDVSRWSRSRRPARTGVGEDDDEEGRSLTLATLLDRVFGLEESARPDPDLEPRESGSRTGIAFAVIMIVVGAVFFGWRYGVIAI